MEGKFGSDTTVAPWPFTLFRLDMSFPTYAAGVVPEGST